MSVTDSTAIEETRNIIKYHFVDKTNNNQNREHNWAVLSVSEQNGCHLENRGCQPCVISTSNKPQFNVAVNGHDYLGGVSCSEVNNNIEHVKPSLASQNMVPHGNTSEIGSNVKSIDKETENNGAKELFLSNSSGLVLKKEKESWTVKLKSSRATSLDSSNLSCLNSNDGTCELSTKTLEKTCDQNQMPHDKGFSEESAKVMSPSSSASCPTSDTTSSYYCNHVADTGTLCKIKIKHMHRNGSVPMTTTNQETHQDGVKVKKKKKLDKLKHSPSVYGTSACRKSAEIANGEHRRLVRRNLLAEGREGEAVAVKALAAANVFSKPNESVRNAESEIARALEIIQLQLRVLQNHKKHKSTKSEKVSQKSGKSKSTTKKCHSWEPEHTIDFADVFPLPPSLMVKDGDLHQACSMKVDPHCEPGPSHPFWKWQLGQKPLPRPPKPHPSQISIENSSEGTSR